MLILTIILAVTYGWMDIYYGEANHIDVISFLVIGFVVSGIIFRAFKKSAKKFSNTVTDEESPKLECMDIFFNTVDVTTNWILILQILYIITTILFFVCVNGYIKSDVINSTNILIVTGIIDVLMILVSYISSKKSFIKCIFAVFFMEAFAINTIIFFGVLLFVFFNVAIAWIILFAVISLIFLN